MANKTGEMADRHHRIDRDEAEALAIAALSYLAGASERLERFLALTGLDAGTLRETAATAEFQTAVLDHVMSDESLLLAFCANCGVDPTEVAPARRLLSGEAA